MYWGIGAGLGSRVQWWPRGGTAATPSQAGQQLRICDACDASNSMHNVPKPYRTATEHSYAGMGRMRQLRTDVNTDCVAITGGPVQRWQRARAGWRMIERSIGQENGILQQHGAAVNYCAHSGDAVIKYAGYEGPMPGTQHSIHGRHKKCQEQLQFVSGFKQTARGELLYGVRPSLCANRQLSRSKY